MILKYIFSEYIKNVTLGLYIYKYLIFPKNLNEENAHFFTSACYVFGSNSR